MKGVSQIWAAFIAAIMLPLAPAAADPIPRGAPVSGEVISVRGGETITFIETRTEDGLVVKQSLKAGDEIKTNARGALAIVFADQTQLRLARNTTLIVKQVSAGSPSEIDMKRGALWARSPRGKSNLSVRTPSATAAIRGTEWSLTVSDSQTDLQVASGRVDFSNPQGGLSITGGEAARAVAGQAPVRIAVVSHNDREQMLYYLSPDFIPGNLPSGSLLGPIYEAAYLGDLKAAEAGIDQVLAGNNPEARAFWLGAKIGFLNGDAGRISETLARGLRAYPGNASLLTLQAEYEASFLGRPDLALETARTASLTEPDNIPAKIVLGRILIERGHDLEAAVVTDAVLAAEPAHVEAQVLKAEILIKQNRPEQARAVLENILASSSALSTARLAAGQAKVLQGDDDAALREFLAASAENPSYSIALLRLAEVYGRMGQNSVAKQQLDAADRLDPNTPFTPLYRTSLALHNYESSAAIESAQDALARFQSRGGLYENLSENRESGSNISRAFRFAELEAWGRYYGDRVFDSFQATSYFDQTLNETAGPFFIRREDTSFNPQNGDDLDQISSYLQGVVLDPLSVASAERELQISRESFLEGMVQGQGIISDTSELFRQRASFNGRKFEFLGQDGLSGAISAAYEHSDVSGDFPDQNTNSELLETYSGIALSPKNYISTYASYRHREREQFTSRDILIVKEEGDRILQEQEVTFGFLFWTHRLNDNQNLVFGGGLGRSYDYDNTIFAFDFSAPTLPDFHQINYEDQDYYLLSANYSQRIDEIDLKVGIENFSSNVTNGRTVLDVFPDGSEVAVLPLQETENNRDEIRIYGDVRWKLTEKLLGQFQLSRTERDSPGDKVDFLNYNVAGALEPVQGHWLRASVTRRNDTVVPFTLAPITALGLKGSLVPIDPGERITSRIFRWDAEWNDKFFSSIEYQDQSFGRLSYRTPDGGERVGSVVKGELDQLSISANFWMWDNFAISADYRRVNTEVLQGGAIGDPVPFVPKETGTVELVWVHPKRIKTRLAAKYVGPQQDSINIPIGDFLTFDAFVDWQPLGKGFEINAGLLNLLDDDHEVTIDIPAPGRTVFLSAKARF